MDTMLTNFDEESQSVIKELAKEGIKFERLLKKLQKAKKEIATEERLRRALEDKIKK
jgi:Ca2+-binding EF-hand superfamily protein